MRLRGMSRAVVFFLLGILFLPPSQGMAGQIQGSATGGRNSPVDSEQLSRKEREWFQTFLEGTFYTRGWKDITAEVLEKTPHARKNELRQTLECLGTRIGREWSRNNDIRKIDTDMLEQWGELLRHTAERKPDMIPQVLAKINRKVGRLLD